MGVFKKNGSWWIDYYYQGKRFRRKVCPSKKVAELALANVQIQIAKKEFLGIVETKEIQFKDFATEYLDYSQANKAFRTFKGDRETVLIRLLPRWEDKSLQQITAKMIEDFKIARREKFAPGTVNRDLTTIKHLFRKAVDWGYLEKNPAEKVKFLNRDKPSPRHLSREEVAALLDSCRLSRRPHLDSVVLVALNTGMRRGEIFNLRWEDVEFGGRRLNVVSRGGKSTKNHESRSIPMNETLFDVLKRQPKQPDSPYVFTSADGHPCVGLDYLFPRAVKRAGIPHARFHDLRHTFASQLVMEGVDIRSVQELLGHRDIQMTMKYAHLAPGHMRRAVEVLDGHQMDTNGEMFPDSIPPNKT